LARLALALFLGLVAAPVPAPAADDASSAAALEAKVSTLLVEKLGDDAKTIKVALVKGKIVLVGEVEDRATREHSYDVARTVPGVTKVDDKVKAKNERSVASGKLEDEAADNALEKSVRSALKKELGQHAGSIKAEVVNGVALLVGRVPDAARKEIALKTAGAVPGVRKVVEVVSINRS
jgi:hyperosmotically inducible protein